MGVLCFWVDSSLNPESVRVRASYTTSMENEDSRHLCEVLKRIFVKTLSTSAVSLAGRKRSSPCFDFVRRALEEKEIKRCKPFHPPSESFMSLTLPSPAPLLFWDRKLSAQTWPQLDARVSPGPRWPSGQGPSLTTGKNPELAVLPILCWKWAPGTSRPRPCFPECLSVTLLRLEPSRNSPSIQGDPARTPSHQC